MVDSSYSDVELVEVGEASSAAQMLETCLSWLRSDKKIIKGCDVVVVVDLVVVVVVVVTAYEMLIY